MWAPKKKALLYLVSLIMQKVLTLQKNKHCLMPPKIPVHHLIPPLPFLPDASTLTYRDTMRMKRASLLEAI